jgi:hypothetical protein
VFTEQTLHTFLSRKEETVSPKIRLQAITTALAAFGRLIHRCKPVRNEADNVVNYIFMLVLFDLFSHANRVTYLSDSKDSSMCDVLIDLTPEVQAELPKAMALYTCRLIV